MKNFKILIVEDEILIAEHIKDYLLNFGFSHISMAHTKNTALEALSCMEIDLILLDLHLQQPKDGLEIARSIDKTKKCPYIFITANVDVLIIQEAIQVNASGYITKPVKKTDLFAAIQLALKTNIAPELSFLSIKENNTTTRIPTDDILYIESNGNYIHIFTKIQKIIARQSLEWAELNLPEHKFKRIHRSYIVNLMAVQKMNTRFVSVNDVELPVSRANSMKISDFTKATAEKRL